MRYLQKANGVVDPRTWEIDVTLFDHSKDNVPKLRRMPLGNLIQPHFALQHKLNGGRFLPGSFSGEIYAE